MFFKFSEVDNSWLEAATVPGVAARLLKPGRGRQIHPTKRPVSIRLSRQVLEYFRAQGPGWQTRIDEVLCYYVAVRGHRWRLQRLIRAQLKVEARQGARGRCKDASIL
jgi:uncharacterized protein (DUF4415 family)